MSLKSKVLILTCGSFLALIAILVLFSRFFLFHHLSEIEEYSVTQEVHLTVDSMLSDSSSLESTSAFFATRDETYRFMVDNDSTYLETNITDETLANLKLNLMAFINVSNRITYAKAFDLNGKQEAPLPQNLEKYLSTVSSRLRGDKGGTISGIVLLDECPAIVAGAPVLHSSGNGPTNGTLVIARYIDGERINKIEQKLSLQMMLLPLDRQEIPDAELEAFFHLSKGPHTYVSAINDGLSGYALLNDINNKPLLLLKVVLTGTMSEYSQNLVFYIMLVIIVVGFILGVLVLFWLRKNILSKLTRLSRNILAIGETSDNSMRLLISGHDEVSRITASVNGMLSSLEQSRNELERSREFSENLLNTSPNPILVFKAEASVKYVNPAFEKLTGFSKEEVTGTKPPFPWWTEPVEVYRNFEVNFQRELSKFEMLFRTKSEKPFWVELTGVNVTVRGQFKYRLVTWVDITERKAAEDMLRYSEERFRSFVDNSNDCIFVLDTDGNFKFASPSVRQLGYESQDLIGKNAFTLAHPDDAPSLISRFIKKIITGGDVKPVTVRARHEQDQWLTLEITGKSLIHNPIVDGFLLTARDITERCKMENRLKASEQFSRNIMEKAPNPIAVMNPDASIFYVNAAFEKLTGFTRDEVLGQKPPYPWWLPGDWEKRTRVIQDVCTSTVPVEAERRFKNKKGEYFWVISTAVSIVSDGETTRTFCSWVDITEQKHLQANTQFYISKITMAQEEERKRIARDLHDATVQSLVAIVMELDYLARDKKKIKKEDLIERVHEQREKANEVVDDLRRFIYQLRPSIIDQGLIPALEFLIDELNQEGKISARFEVRGQEERLSSETEVHLFRIAQEALQNVRKHSRATEVILVLQFASATRLTVADNGVGFETACIWDDLAGGGKLGLIGMKERALLIGGDLRILSQAGKGTRIIVDIGKGKSFL